MINCVWIVAIPALLQNKHLLHTSNATLANLLTVYTWNYSTPTRQSCAHKICTGWQQGWYQNI